MLLPFALVPFFLAVRTATPRQGGLVGYAFGVAFWLSTVPWIAYTVHHYGGVGWPLAGLALLLTALILGAAFAILGVLVALAAPLEPVAVLLVWPAAWVVQEGIRTYALSGFPWALLGYSLAGRPELIQAAALGGVGLVSFLIVLVNACVFLALMGRGRGRLPWLLAAAVLAGGVFAAGRQRIARLSGQPPAGTVRVALMQPGVPQEERWDAAERDRIYTELLADTYTLCAREHPALVLWPESAMPEAWSWSPRLRRDLPRLCRTTGAAVLFSTVWSDDPDAPDAAYYNSALLVTPAGPVLPPYHKLRLVPFGEYVPLASLLTRIGPISKAVPGSFTPGREIRLLPFDSLRLGGSICYEVVYGWIARAEVRAGADVLFTLTNDSWYGRFGAQGQHWQAAVLRAVETGRPLLRAAITGRTGWVDSLGRAHVIPEVEKGALVADVPLTAFSTPSVPLGDTLLAVCALGVLAAILRARLRPRGPEEHPE